MISWSLIDSADARRKRLEAQKGLAEALKLTTLASFCSAPGNRIKYARSQFGKWFIGSLKKIQLAVYYKHVQTMLVDQWQIDKDSNQPAPHHWGNTPLRWAAEELSCEAASLPSNAPLQNAPRVEDLPNHWGLWLWNIGLSWNMICMLIMKAQRFRITVAIKNDSVFLTFVINMYMTCWAW